MNPAPERWCLVVPVKRLAAAKSRLAGQAAPVRSELALAFALDTVTAALACMEVRAVFAVTDEPLAAPRLASLGAHVVADTPDAGLNSALAHGAQAAGLAHVGCGIGALAADLPALRPAALAQALQNAAAFPTSFVADAAGTGTTLLLAHLVGWFRPRFGPGSALAHSRAGAEELQGEALTSLRRDVDTEADLTAARTLGLGRHTTRVLARLDRAEPGRGGPLPTDREGRSGG